MDVFICMRVCLWVLLSCCCAFAKFCVFSFLKFGLVVVHWDTVIIFSYTTAPVYVTVLQALIWFAIAWKSVGNHFIHRINLLRTWKKTCGNVYTMHAQCKSTHIRKIVLFLCVFVCVYFIFRLRFLKSKTFIEWKTLI